MNGYEVTQEIRGVHPLHTDYPLLPGDLLVKDKDGTFAKVAPGVAILGFVLTDRHADCVIPVTYNNNGLEYWIEERHA